MKTNDTGVLARTEGLRDLKAKIASLFGDPSAPVNVTGSGLVYVRGELVDTVRVRPDGKGYRLVVVQR